MSRFLSARLSEVRPYVPGEQPQDLPYVKLNTNESPFPPTPKAVEYAAREAARLNLYSDPDCRSLVKTAAEYFGVAENELVFTNGSDAALNYAMVAFCDDAHPAFYPDITYGFYPVIAGLNRIPVTIVPLREGFVLDPADYVGIRGMIFIANPNAPTGKALSTEKIETILTANPEAVVLIDEAYVDFGAESCVPLIHRYDNLVVVQTFSKSRSLAGGRLGVAFGCADLIRDILTVKNSCDPYAVNRMTMAAGIGSLLDDEVVKANIREVIRVREMTVKELAALGFALTDSLANFVFARHPRVSGRVLYEKLKSRGVLVRHFETPVLTDYNRITIGSEEQMRILLERIREILEETT